LLGFPKKNHDPVTREKFLEEEKNIPEFHVRNFVGDDENVGNVLYREAGKTALLRFGE
jgi:hypothetical protein